jgi:hypothetical protein
MGKHRIGIRTSGSSRVTADISIAAKVVRRQTDAASATAVMEFIAASFLMGQKGPVIILSQLLRRKPHASVVSSR